MRAARVRLYPIVPRAQAGDAATVARYDRMAEGESAIEWQFLLIYQYITEVRFYPSTIEAANES